MAEGDIAPEEYMRKLDHFIISRTNGVKGLNNQYQLRACYERVAGFYERNSGAKRGKSNKEVKGELDHERTYSKGTLYIGRRWRKMFDGVTYPWEVLPKIGSFIMELGKTLSEDEYEKRGENMDREVGICCADC